MAEPFLVLVLHHVGVLLTTPSRLEV